MKNLPYLLLFLTASTILSSKPEYIIHLKDAYSAEIGIEDLQGRKEYEHLLSADPRTGLIPYNIHKEELSFAQSIEASTRHLRTNNLDIQSAGPFNVGGRTRAVAFDVRDENIILAGGVSGGIWKSADGGKTWVRKSDPENRNSVTCLAQDTRLGNEDVWYHGTGELVGNSARGGGAPFRGNGIYKSTDNGETWDVIPSTVDSDPHVFNSQFQYIWDIVINKNNLLEDEILISAYGGILKSSDGGSSWEVVLGQELFGLSDDVDLNESDASFYTSLASNVNGLFFATLSTVSGSDNNSTSAGLYVSEDGSNWANLNPPFTEETAYRRVEIGTSESNPNTVYFLFDPSFILKYRLDEITSGNAIGAFKVREIPSFGGELGNYDSQGSYNMMIKVHPENVDIVFVGGTNLYRSTDGFEDNENTKWIGGYNPKGGSGIYLNHHPDQHDLLFYPSNPDKILSASDGGLIVSDNGVADSVKWRSINNGFITSQFFTIAQSQEANDPIILGGLQDNGTDLTNASGLTDWVNVIGGDGGYAATTREKVLWYTSFQKGQTYRLTLNDDFKLTSFGRIDPEDLVNQAGGPGFLFINPYILDPINQNRMFLGGGGHLYFNDNVSQIPGGSQDPTSIGWNKVTRDTLYVGSLSALEMALDGSTLYFGSAGGQVFRLDNANDFLSFKVNEITALIFPENGYVSCVAVNPDDKEHLLVVFSNYNIPSIFESKDGGDTFSDVSGNLEQNPDGTGNGSSIRWGEIIPTNTGNRFLVGTSTGLYSTELLSGNSTVWTKESTDVIGGAVITMMDYRVSDGKLAIATHGNGAFTTHISDFKQLTKNGEGENFELGSVYPNPFEISTKINFNIPEDGIVRIDVFSIKGEHISNLLWAPQFGGANSVTWNGRTNSGTSLSNGIYVYKIQFNGQSKSGRLMLKR